MSELHEKPMENEEELSDIVELVDETGRVLKFYHLATMDYKDECFAFFQAAEEIEGAEEDEVIIFQIQDDGKGGDVLLPVEDEDKLDAVYAEFCKMMDEDEDDCECDCADCEAECDCHDCENEETCEGDEDCNCACHKH